MKLQPFGNPNSESMSLAARWDYQTLLGTTVLDFLAPSHSESHGIKLPKKYLT